MSIAKFALLIPPIVTALLIVIAIVPSFVPLASRDDLRGAEPHASRFGAAFISLRAVIATFALAAVCVSVIGAIGVVQP